MGLPLDIDDFQRVSERTPLLADLKPAGKYVAADVYAAGGIPVIAKRLLDGKHANGSTMTVTGKTFAEEANAAQETPGQTVIAPLSKPLKTTGGLVILKGNLAPGGGVVKMSGHERQSQTGPARVFDSEEAATRRSGTSGTRGTLGAPVTGSDFVEPMLVRAREKAAASKADAVFAAADALRHYKNIEVARTLVLMLSDRDFGIAWTAHQSLLTLTGKDLRYDEVAWLAYLTGPEKPFG